jgi:hypothetical protein
MYIQNKIIEYYKLIVDKKYRFFKIFYKSSNYSRKLTVNVLNDENCRQSNR